MGSDEAEIIRVVAVDDQRLFARGLSGLVDMLAGLEVVGVAYDGVEGVALCRREEPDVVLMDISMPNMDGISATREIKDLLPQTAVIILTGHEEDEHVFEGIKAGAQGYLLKDAEPEDLSRAIHTVHAGDTIIAPDLAQKMLNTFEGGRPGGSRLNPPPLTERELEVIRALAQGMSDRQIANSLGISEKTVRNHTSNIYRKLHIFDRTQAVIYAIREGVIDVEDLEYRPPGNPHRNLRALSETAAHLDLCAHGLDPLAHPLEAHATSRGRGIETAAIVGDLGQQRLTLGPQRHPDVPRPGMTLGVGKCLLQDVQELNANLRGNASGKASLTVNVTLRPGVNCRFSSTSDSTDSTNELSFSCLRS